MPTSMLGPCVGHTTSSTAKVWIYSETSEELFCVLNEDFSNLISFKKLNKDVSAFIADISGLEPFTKYSYKIVNSEKRIIDLEGLEVSDLFFTTMPDENDDFDRFDFLLMSCNDPINAEKEKKYRNKGFALWEKLPSILEESVKGSDKKVMIGLLGGDQVYSDDIANTVFKSNDSNDRLKIYIENYKKYWSNNAYRKVLCSLPCYLMWDDHDIIDGWGSREDSFDSNNDFLPQWKNLFGSAKEAFKVMQASRNPEPLTHDGFDFGVRIGPIGIIGADLRSNRNSRKGAMWSQSQFDAFKKWISQNQNKIEVLFFLSPVVFAHGTSAIDENIIIKRWGKLLSSFEFFQDINKYLFIVISLLLSSAIGMLSVFWGAILFAILMGIKFFVTPIFFSAAGDLRDDINDSWGAEINSKLAEEFLDYSFSLQNETDVEKRVHFVILSGDIHTGGYSMIYSNYNEHSTRPAIPHVVSSPVAYPPFPWIGEAVYRKFTKGDAFIGVNKKYQAQISHHFTERNVVICSLRRKKDSSKAFTLKIKYYLEGMPEPQITFFDLEQSSHREKIDW